MSAVTAVAGAAKQMPWSRYSSKLPTAIAGNFGLASVGMEVAGGIGTYHSVLQGSSPDYRPNLLEKVNAGRQALTQVALGLLLPNPLQLAIYGGIGAYQVTKAWSTGQQIQGRNWYKPNTTPLYRQRVVQRRAQGLSDLGSGHGFIGHEARIMAGRGF